MLGKTAVEKNEPDGLDFAVPEVSIIQWQGPRYRPWLKTIAAIIAGVFLLQQVVWAGDINDIKNILPDDKAEISSPMQTMEDAEEAQQRQRELLEEKEEIAPTEEPPVTSTEGEGIVIEKNPLRLHLNYVDPATNTVNDFTYNYDPYFVGDRADQRKTPRITYYDEEAGVVKEIQIAYYYNLEQSGGVDLSQAIETFLIKNKDIIIKLQEERAEKEALIDEIKKKAEELKQIEDAITAEYKKFLNRIKLSEDGKSVSVLDENGNVIITSADATLVYYAKLIPVLSGGVPQPERPEGVVDLELSGASMIVVQSSRIHQMIMGAKVLYLKAYPEMSMEALKAELERVKTEVMPEEKANLEKARGGVKTLLLKIQEFEVQKQNMTVLSKEDLATLLGISPVIVPVVAGEPGPWAWTEEGLKLLPGEETPGEVKPIDRPTSIVRYDRYPNIAVKSIERVIWNNGSLGGYKEGDLFTQGMIEGFKIVLSYNGKDYEYHTDLNKTVLLDPKVRQEIEARKKAIIDEITKKADALQAIEDEIRAEYRKYLNKVKLSEDGAKVSILDEDGNTLLTTDDATLVYYAKLIPALSVVIPAPETPEGVVDLELPHYSTVVVNTSSDIGRMIMGVYAIYINANQGMSIKKLEEELDNLNNVLVPREKDNLEKAKEGIKVLLDKVSELEVPVKAYKEVEKIFPEVKSEVEREIATKKLSKKIQGLTTEEVKLEREEIGEKVIRSVLAFLNNVINSTSSTFADFRKLLAKYNPAILTQEGLDQISSYLRSQVDNVFNCAAFALGRMLNYANDVKIATTTIIIDILYGALLPTAQGILKTSLFAIKEAAEKLQNFTLYALKISIDELKKIATPVIAHINNVHYVVITKVTDTIVNYVDNSGKFFTETIPEFIKKWKGVILSTVKPEGASEMEREEMKEILGAGIIADLPVWGGQIIQDKINAAQRGDTIVLDAGIYNLTSNLNITKNVKIVGKDPGNTIINLGNYCIYIKDPAFYSQNEYYYQLFKNLNDVTIENVTIKGYRGQSAEGAIQNYSGKLTLRNCKITDNQGVKVGAIYSSWNSKLYLENTVIANNKNLPATSVSPYSWRLGTKVFCGTIYLAGGASINVINSTIADNINDSQSFVITTTREGTITI
ncbi:MAG: hypothetical protein KKI13_05855, partial [Candidatus Omnitrophica bacterium]|nr:hypothetical protein [Candidatus Omnitrophota bacterium]MCG2704676.1 cysteine peptidase family C39 domain-containing protein [Candidatus Omnitrophota bacterium]